MINIGGVDIKSYMTMQYAFSGVRIIESTFIPVLWELKINMVNILNFNPKMSSRDKVSFQQFEKLADEAYQKIYYWLDVTLPHIIITDINNEFGMYISNISSNLMMYCPGEANDSLIVRLLHAKLTSIANNNIQIADITIKASDLSAQYVYAPYDIGDYELPTTTEDLYTGEVLNDIPWWFRNDGFSFEFLRPEGVDTDIHELFKDAYDPFLDFQVQFEEEDEDEEKEKAPAEIIKWKPKKV